LSNGDSPLEPVTGKAPTDGIIPRYIATCTRVLCLARVVVAGMSKYQSMALHPVDLTFELGAKVCLQCNIVGQRKPDTWGASTPGDKAAWPGALLSSIGYRRSSALNKVCMWAVLVSGPAMRHALGTHMHCSPARGIGTGVRRRTNAKGQRGWIGTSGWFSLRCAFLSVGPFGYWRNSAIL